MDTDVSREDDYYASVPPSETVPGDIASPTPPPISDMPEMEIRWIGNASETLETMGITATLENISEIASTHQPGRVVANGELVLEGDFPRFTTGVQLENDFSFFWPTVLVFDNVLVIYQLDHPNTETTIVFYDIEDSFAELGSVSIARRENSMRSPYPVSVIHIPELGYVLQDSHHSVRIYNHAFELIGEDHLRDRGSWSIFDPWTDWASESPFWARHGGRYIVKDFLEFYVEFGEDGVEIGTMFTLFNVMENPENPGKFISLLTTANNDIYFAIRHSSDIQAQLLAVESITGPDYDYSAIISWHLKIFDSWGSITRPFTAVFSDNDVAVTFPQAAATITIDFANGQIRFETHYTSDIFQYAYLIDVSPDRRFELWSFDFIGHYHYGGHGRVLMYDRQTSAFTDFDMLDTMPSFLGFWDNRTLLRGLGTSFDAGSEFVLFDVITRIERPIPVDISPINEHYGLLGFATHHQTGRSVLLAYDRHWWPTRPEWELEPINADEFPDHGIAILFCFFDADGNYEYTAASGISTFWMIMGYADFATRWEGNIIYMARRNWERAAAFNTETYTEEQAETSINAIRTALYFHVREINRDRGNRSFREIWNLAIEHSLEDYLLELLDSAAPIIIKEPLTGVRVYPASGRVNWIFPQGQSLTATRDWWDESGMPPRRPESLSSLTIGDDGYLLALLSDQLVAFYRYTPGAEYEMLIAQLTVQDISGYQLLFETADITHRFFDEDVNWFAPIFEGVVELIQGEGAISLAIDGNIVGIISYSDGRVKITGRSS